MPKKLHFTNRKKEQIILDLLKYIVEATLQTFPRLTNRELWRGRIAEEVKEILEDLDYCFFHSLKEAVRDEKRHAKKQVRKLLRSLRR